MGEEEDGRADERTSLSRLGVHGQWQGKQRYSPGKNPQETQGSVEDGNALFRRHQQDRSCTRAGKYRLPTRCLK